MMYVRPFRFHLACIDSRDGLGGKGVRHRRLRRRNARLQRIQSLWTEALEGGRDGRVEVHT